MPRRRFRGILALLLVTGGASGCTDDSPSAPVSPSTPAISAEGQASKASIVAANAVNSAAVEIPSRVVFGTYDGSGEVVHPDVVDFDTPWNGHRFWTVLTPYPGSATKFENPSIFTSDNGETWSVPAGMKNPLATSNRGYLSDPDMLYVSERNELWMYYREVQNRRIGKNDVHIADYVWLATSGDGVSWSTPRVVAADTGKFIVSPTVVRGPDGQWRMYEVDAGVDGCSAKSTRVMLRKSSDGTKWSSLTPVSLVQPGYQAWHIDVQYIAQRGEYWALVAAYDAKQGCTATNLFIATSIDGATWLTYPAPVLARGEFAPFSAAVYRSTFAYHPDGNITLWYSGARIARPASKKKPTLFAWSAAMSYTTIDALFARVTNKGTNAKLTVAPVGSAVIARGTIAP